MEKAAYSPLTNPLVTINLNYNGGYILSFYNSDNHIIKGLTLTRANNQQIFRAYNVNNVKISNCAFYHAAANNGDGLGVKNCSNWHIFNCSFGTDITQIYQGANFVDLLLRGSSSNWIIEKNTFANNKGSYGAVFFDISGNQNLMSQNLFRNVFEPIQFYNQSSNNYHNKPSITRVVTSTNGSISGKSTAGTFDRIEIFRSTDGRKDVSEYIEKGIIADIDGNWIVTGITIAEGEKFIATATPTVEAVINGVTHEVNSTSKFSYWSSPSVCKGVAINHPVETLINNLYNYSYTTSATANTQSINWDFGDGTSSTEISPAHSYNTIGQQNISLTVSFVDGCVVSDTKTINVFSGITPTISVIAPAEVCPNQDVNFTYTSDIEIVESVSWDFGDGTTSIV